MAASLPGDAGVQASGLSAEAKAAREARLLTIAGDYRDYALANPVPRHALEYCRAQLRYSAAMLRSRSVDWRTHGDKLYLLFVKDMAAYEHAADDRAGAPAPSPVGQTLVKETQLREDGGAAEGGPAELFIMTKVDPSEPETDDGWVYAVVSADRTRVIDSGRIASCMACHEQTTRGRLFGPEGTWPRGAAGEAVMPLVPRGGGAR